MNLLTIIRLQITILGGPNSSRQEEMIDQMKGLLEQIVKVKIDTFDMFDNLKSKFTVLSRIKYLDYYLYITIIFKQ